MRLSKEEKSALDIALQDIGEEVYLFGSRTDDNKKGGDIDILVFSKQEPFKLSQKISTKYFMELESKLDVIVFDKDNMSREQNAFLNTLHLIKIK